MVKNVPDSDGDLSILQSEKCLDPNPATNADCTNRAGFWSFTDSFAYDSSGAVTKMQFGNGRWETAS